MPKEKELLMHIGLSETHISIAAVQTGLPDPYVILDIRGTKILSILTSPIKCTLWVVELQMSTIQTFFMEM